MSFVTTKDGTQIFFKDWGPKDAQPLFFHHGWPLSADDWDAQMLFFLAEGFRVVAHDRRGHGRSSQVSDGHDMDHYAADASAVAEHLDLRNAVHIGHSTGGGQVARYVAQHGQPQGRVAKAVLVSAVPPLMVKTDGNPGGTPVAEKKSAVRLQSSPNRQMCDETREVLEDNGRPWKLGGRPSRPRPNEQMDRRPQPARRCSYASIDWLNMCRLSVTRGGA